MTVNPGTSFATSPAANGHKCSTASADAAANPFKSFRESSWLEGTDYELPSTITFANSSFNHTEDMNVPDVAIMAAAATQTPDPNHPVLAPLHRQSTSTMDACNMNEDGSYSDSDAEEWQPNSSYTDTTDSSDGFVNGSLVHNDLVASGSGRLLDDGNDHDMAHEEDDDVDPLFSYHYRRPVGYCINCTQMMFSNVCSSCGHDSDCNSQLFSSECTAAADAAASTPQREALIVWDEQMFLHGLQEAGNESPHPERPDRLRAVIARLESSGLAERFSRVPCREASDAELLAVHTQELVMEVATVSNAAAHNMDGTPLYLQSDTYANAHTFKCAKLAAGGCAEAAVRVARGEARFGAAIVRPPGHHAESNTAMGFCFFNNAAVAARAAQSAGAQRVIILDWDVHHGNGTQHIFEDDPSVLYMSLHRYDRGTFYPGTGGPNEVGLDKGKGFTVNIPWDGGACDADYITAFSQVLLPIAYEYQPDLILVSAGFDAAKGDPIGGCSVSPACYGHMTSLLKGIAPLVVMLEGGYNLTATAESTEACLRVLLGEQPEQLDWQRCASRMAKEVVLEVMRNQSPYWKCLPNLPAWLCNGQADAAAAVTVRHDAQLCTPATLNPSLDDELLAWGGAAAASTLDGQVPATASAGPSRPQHAAGASAEHPGGSAAGVGSRQAAVVAQAAAGSGAGRARLRKPSHHARKMHILRAVHNSAVRAFRRRCSRVMRVRSGKGGL